MSQENLTEEDADRLLAEAYNKPAPAAEVAVVEEPVVELDSSSEVPSVPTPVVENVQEEVISSAPAEKPDAWLNSVPEDVRGKVQERLEALANAEHKIRSDDGRVRAFQRQAEELKQQLKDLHKTPQLPAAPESPTTLEGWQQLIGHDPALASAIEARVKAEIQEFKKSNIDPLVARQQTDEGIARSDMIARERAELERYIPDVDNIKSQPMFVGWLQNEAPPVLRDAYNNSLDHRDYLAVFNQFAVDMINSGRVTMDGQAPSVAAPTANNAVDPQLAQNIADNRTRKLNSPPVIGSTPVQPKTVDWSKPLTTEDADALILAAWNKNKK